MYVDLERLLAHSRLLAQPEERALRGKRGHRVALTGARDRMVRTWLPATHAWNGHRIDKSIGAVDGWTPALTYPPHRGLRPTAGWQLDGGLRQSRPYLTGV
jgi:hypothetical protein